MYESIPKKIWRVVYPALLLFGTYLAVYLLAITAYANFFLDKYINVEVFMAHSGDLISIIALTSGGLISFLFYRKDYVTASKYIYENPKYFIFIILFGILAGHGLSIMVSLLNYSGLFGDYTQTAVMLETSGIIITVVKAVIIVPVVEELVFRGLIFRRMKEYTSFWPAALVSALLFALYHLNLLQGIYAFIYALLLCRVYDIFKNLWACIAMHAAANAFAIAFQLAGFDYPSIAVYIIVMAAALAGAAAVYVLLVSKAVQK